MFLEHIIAFMERICGLIFSLVQDCPMDIQNERLKAVKERYEICLFCSKFVCLIAGSNSSTDEIWIVRHVCLRIYKYHGLNFSKESLDL